MRVIKVSNTFFGALDNASYACILLLLLGSSVLSPAEKDKIGTIFDDPTITDIAIVVTVGLDLIHNIMHNSTSLWNLGRMDIYLVLVLYGVYLILLLINQLLHEGDDAKGDWVYWYVLAFRFACFYLATCSEYWLEKMVLKLIRQLKTGEDFALPVSTCLGNLVQLLGYPYHQLNESDREALETFKGSFCSWNWKESSLNILRKYHTPGHFQTNPPNRNYLVCVIAYPGGIIAFVLSMVLLLLLGLLSLIPLGVVYLFQCCCKRCNWKIYEEIFLW